MKKRIYSTLAAIIMLASCQNEEIAQQYATDPLAVNINALVDAGIPIARSNPLADDASQTAFSIYDQIAISNGGEYVIYELDNTGKWNPQGGKYLKWEKETMNFSAYYPVTEGTSIDTYTLWDSQSSLPLIGKADYMKVEGVSASRTDGAVNLSLARQTARVILEIVSIGDEFIPQNVGFSIIPFSYHNSYVNGLPAGSITGVTPYPLEHSISSDKYEDYYSHKKVCALVIPTGTAQPDKNFIYIGVKDYSNSKSHALFVKGIPAMEAGKSYTYKLHVGKDTATITGVTVEDWGTKITIDDGDAEEPILVSTDSLFTAYLNQTFNLGISDDGLLEDTEANRAALNAVTSIELWSMKNIKSLKGIEHFTNLVLLRCNDTSITTLDVSHNIKLKYLYCYANSIKSLDLSNNVNLVSLYSERTSLESIDLSNNVNLLNLSVSNTSITTLDLSKNTKLKHLACYDTSIPTLDVSNNVHLEALYCYDCHLATLDIRNCDVLSGDRFYCGRQTSDGTNVQNLKLILTSDQQPILNEKDVKNANVTFEVKEIDA